VGENMSQDSKSGSKATSVDKLVSVVDDEFDISTLFRDALCENMDGVKVLSFNDPIKALEHFTENKSAYTGDFRFQNARSEWIRVTKESKGCKFQRQNYIDERI